MSEASKRRKQEKILRPDQAVILGAACLICGFFFGMITYSLIGGSGPSASAPPPTIASPGQPAPPPTISAPGQTLPDYTARIRETKAILEKDPNNRRAWVQLGNDYFDSNQFNESIAAYTRALELDANDPNVLTDRGVMFRKIGDFTSAEADFLKASQIDKTHLNSAFNLGIVRFYDQGNAQGAIEAWEDFLRRNPPPQAVQTVQQNLAKARSMAEAQKAAQPK